MKKECDIIENFYKGILNSKDKMAPSYINNKNPKYLEIDGRFYSGILIIDYYREYSEILLKNPKTETTIELAVIEPSIIDFE